MRRVQLETNLFDGVMNLDTGVSLQRLELWVHDFVCFRLRTFIGPPTRSSYRGTERATGGRDGRRFVAGVRCARRRGGTTPRRGRIVRHGEVIVGHSTHAFGDGTDGTEKALEREKVLLVDEVVQRIDTDPKLRRGDAIGRVVVIPDGGHYLLAKFVKAVLPIQRREFSPILAAAWKGTAAVPAVDEPNGGVIGVTSAGKCSSAVLIPASVSARTRFRS